MAGKKGSGPQGHNRLFMGYDGSMTEYTVQVDWDDDASVWTATSDDIAGLVLESSSMDALLERVRFAVPELLALNAPTKEPVALNIISSRTLVAA